MLEYVPVVLALGRWRQGSREFKVMSKVSLGYFVLEERKDERRKGKGKESQDSQIITAYLGEHNLKMAKN